MKRQRAFILLVALALLSAACKEERSERVAASYSTVSKATERPVPTRRVPQAVAVGTDAVPVEEDYEARATSSITDANLAAKLAELERELRL
jgi:hypothetical protein